MNGRALAERKVSIRLASQTDVGRLRAANEDSCGLFDGAGGARLLVVADGMGGHRGGATASQLAVATIGEFFEQYFGRAAWIEGDPAASGGEKTLRRAIGEANRRIFALAQTDPELEGMGTTVVAFLLELREPGLRGAVAHVGDSRAYRHRQGRLETLTTDHSVVAEMHRRGLISAEEALFHPRRNEILRSVGLLPTVEIEAKRVDLEAGDSILLCSDGLSGVLDEEEIAAVVARESPEDAVETLIRLANERGGPDNITVQLFALPAVPAIAEAAGLPGEGHGQGRGRGQDQGQKTAAAPGPLAAGALAAVGAEVGAGTGAGDAARNGAQAGAEASSGESPAHRDLRRKRRVVWVAAVALVLAAAGLFLSR